jgi:uncharacterized protein YciI
MELFVYIGRDGAHGAELRKTVRDKHLAHLRSLVEADRIRFAGPLRDDAGNPCGSVIVFEAENLEEARRLATSDPYNVEGVFQTVEVYSSMQVFPGGGS